MEDDDIVREIEEADAEKIPSKKLGEKVHRGFLFASIFRAIINLYLSSLALVFGSTVKLLGDGRSDDIESDQGRQRKE